MTLLIRTTLSCTLAFLSTLALFHVLGLNERVVHLAAKLWGLSLYFNIFLPTLFVLELLVIIWCRSRNLRFGFTLFLGVGAGHLAAIISDEGAALAVEDGLLRIRSSIELIGGWCWYVAFSVIFPVLLLGWLYGGSLVGMEELVHRLGSRRWRKSTREST